MNPGSATTKAEEKKRKKYSSLSSNYLFIPAAFETFGAWGPESKALIHRIGNLISIETGEDRATRFLGEKISLEIQRGNSISVLGTLPPSNPFN